METQTSERITESDDVTVGENGSIRVRRPEPIRDRAPSLRNFRVRLGDLVFVVCLAAVAALSMIYICECCGWL